MNLLLYITIATTDTNDSSIIEASCIIVQGYSCRIQAARSNASVEAIYAGSWPHAAECCYYD